MKKGAFAIALLLAVIASNSWAQTADSISVTRLAICAEVKDREPVGEATSFDPAIATLYCFTELNGAAGQVVHAWLQGDSLRSEVKLNKGNAGRWRTWSAKTMPANWTGTWRVEVRDDSGKVLKSATFSSSAPKAEQ